MMLSRKNERRVVRGRSYTFGAIDNYGCYAPEEVRVRWFLGGRLVSTEHQWIHTFENMGEYWITVKVYDNSYKLLDSKERNVIVESDKSRDRLEQLDERDYIPEIIRYGITQYAKVLVHIRTCSSCNNLMVNLDNPFLSMLSLESQIKKAGIKPKSNISGVYFYDICQKCADEDVAVVDCALCGLKIKSSQIKESFGDSDYLCMNCYDTIPAKRWCDKKMELESLHQYDNG